MRARKDDVRTWHYIKRNIRTCVPTAILCVDTETEGMPIPDRPNATLQVLKLWCATSARIQKGTVRSRKNHFGTTTDEFWQLVRSLLSDRRPLWLFDHNLGFDLTVLKFWQELERQNFVFTEGNATAYDNGTPSKKWQWKGMAVLDDPPTIIECRYAGSREVLICVDTYNYFRSSVARLGESVGLQKLEMPPGDSDAKSLITYCQRDVAIIHKAITGLMQFVVDQDLGMWRYTAPAQAFSAYRHRFMKEKILVHGNKDAIALEREAYYGGRLECHFIGDVSERCPEVDAYYEQRLCKTIPSRIGPIYVLDVQSCYPAMMLWKMFPRAILDYVVGIHPRYIAEFIKHHACIARVTINDGNNVYPVHRNGKTFMARGRFVTSLCGPELERAVNNNAVENVGAVAVYERADLFSSYVSYFWNLRQQYKLSGEKAKESWCKLMLNSLAGKFGQKARKWTDADDVESPIPWGLFLDRDCPEKRSVHYRALAWHVQEEQKAGESVDSCPAIAAYVTSYAREYLNTLIECTGYHNTYYVDTDCLHCNQQGYDNLNKKGYVQDGQIGMLSLRGTHESGEYRGLKNYTVGSVDCIAGIKGNARRITGRMYTQPKFQKLRSIIAAEPSDGVIVEDVTVNANGIVGQGRILPDGTVLPQVLSE